MTFHKKPLSDKNRNPVLLNLRRKHSWTYRQLGEAVGMSHSHLHLVETGRKAVSESLIRTLLSKRLITQEEARKMVHFYVERRIFRTTKKGVV